MQRAGRPVHINDTLTHADDGVLPTKYFIPRKNSPQSRTQNLFGPNWNAGGGAISPNVTATAPTVSGTTDLTWNDGGGKVDGDGTTTGYAKPGARSKSFTIKNSGAAGKDDIQVSFDGGATYFTLGPGESYSAEISIYYFLVKRVTPGGEDGSFESVAVLA